MSGSAARPSQSRNVGAEGLLSPPASGNLSPTGKNEGLWLFLLLLVSRIALLALLALATAQREFTWDAELHMRSVRQPLFILLGQDAYSAYFPPLVPVILMVLVRPFLLFFGEFLALRAGLIVIELAAWPVVWTLLRRYVRETHVRRWLALSVIFSPAVWFTTVVMPQEDIMALLMMAVAALLLLSGRDVWAAFACGMGVVTAKIFFLVPLLAFCVAPGRMTVRDIARRSCAAFLPIAIVYAFSGYFWWRNDIGMPLIDFNPVIGPTQSIWLLIHEIADLPVSSIRGVSSLVAFAAGVLPLAIVKLRGDACTPGEVLRLSCAMTCAVLVCFYMTMGEYFLLLVPALMLTVNWRVAVATIVALLTLTWGVNWFYGVASAREIGGPAVDSVFVRLYDLIFPVPPNLMKQLALGLFIVASFALTAYLVQRVLRRAPLPYPLDGGAEGRPASSSVSAATA